MRYTSTSLRLVPTGVRSTVIVRHDKGVAHSVNGTVSVARVALVRHGCVSLASQNNASGVSFASRVAPRQARWTTLATRYNDSGTPQRAAV